MGARRTFANSPIEFPRILAKEYMRKDIKDLWVKALRSGEFEQCKGRLEHNGKYCVLGVLSALALIEGKCTYGHRGKGTFDGRSYTLSYNVMAWAGIGLDEELDDDLDPLQPYLQRGAGKVNFSYRGRPTNLLILNDSGMCFEELADIIEENWRSL